MAAAKKTRGQRVTASAARGVSWMSLVAATTIGVGVVEQVRAHIQARDAVPTDGELRLIVQSYRKDTLDGQRLPEASARPLASIQRAITAEELHAGVDVSLLSVPVEGMGEDSMVVAWVERGVPNLDFDALEARPREGAYYGVAQHGSGPVVVHLARS